MNKPFLSIIVLALLIVTSCSKSVENQKEDDRKKILEYLEDNKINATETDSGLFYFIEHEGDGEYPKANSNVDVYYRGYLLDGTQFDSNMNNLVPITLNLQRVIPGWTEGLQLFSEGSKGKLFIPSHLGYGKQGAGTSIPKNAVLIFDIELLGVH